MSPSRLPSGGFHRFRLHYSIVLLLSPRFFPPLRLYGIPAVSSAGKCWLSHVDALSLYSMIGSPTPQQHPKSHHINKLVFCFPPTQQRRPAGLSLFRCSMATLLSYCLRLDCTVASTIPRLASGDVANTLPDEISTRRAGGLFVLQSSVFWISEKLLNGEQDHALTTKPSKRDYL